VPLARPQAGPAKLFASSAVSSTSGRMTPDGRRAEAGCLSGDDEGGNMLRRIAILAAALALTGCVGLILTTSTSTAQPSSLWTSQPVPRGQRPSMASHA
jgi:hypothetical protein